MNLCDLNEIRSLLGRYGFRFSKSMGQNFLINSWVPERIAQSLQPGCGVVEVGPGIGPLTAQLCQRAQKVVAVELDKTLMPVLEETLAPYDNVEVVNSDILKTDIPALVEEKLAGLHPVACANLPYYITSAAISALIDAKCFESITVMVQKEVAARICSKAGSKDYGAFTVYCSYHTRPELLFDVPPSCFYPQPKVTSTVIRLNCLKAPPVQTDEKLFFTIVKLSFAQRRKTLVNGLAAGLPLSKGQITEAILSCGHGENIRGETLDVEGFANLTNVISKML